ncbi:MAG: DUF1311 domain-containing protein [Rhodanobacteraceae bacterium]|nr:DUF1311 domain-containing protein [Rhodanobacteraceae bacterium]MBK7043330.1 DUF1311 domain-containing protein [Rhodanobacteraceae bacterium]MBP9155170.1 DUF1311 domain-containing protein [Xanthomonadales bacterium]HQW80973.1 lysozyme inhibitor LprI family protein [Pseudomonadota bacterium]
MRIGLIALLALPAVAGSAASFDCVKAATKVERRICADATLSDLDLRLSLVYRQALAIAELDEAEPKASQRAWIKRRNACADSTCIGIAYRERIIDLEDALGQSLSADTVAGEYERSDPKFDNDRVPASITVKALPDGRVRIDGEALWIGNADNGNVHTGTIEGDHELHAGVVDYRDGNEEWSCTLTLRFTDEVLDVTEPAMNCGGMNVSFGGHYEKR